MVLRQIKIGDYIIKLIFIMMSFIFLYPIIRTLSISLASPAKMSDVVFLPKEFNITAYRFVLSDKYILRYYYNSIRYAAIGTFIMIILTSFTAYPLIINSFSGKKIITIIIIITMFFSGGMIPTYLVIRNLGLINSIWAIVLPGSVPAWYVVIFRTFFSEIPTSIRESAIIDGAGHFRILLKIVLPLSKPLLATFTLFSIVGYWNDYFSPMIYLSKEELYPLSLLLRKIVVLMELSDISSRIEVAKFSAAEVNSMNVKSAAVIVTIVPIMCVYPFLQKYFAKGIIIGSLKG